MSRRKTNIKYLKLILPKIVYKNSCLTILDIELVVNVISETRGRNNGFVEMEIPQGKQVEVRTTEEPEMKISIMRNQKKT